MSPLKLLRELCAICQFHIPHPLKYPHFILSQVLHINNFGHDLLVGSKNVQFYKTFLIGGLLAIKKAFTLGSACLTGFMVNTKFKARKVCHLKINPNDCVNYLQYSKKLKIVQLKKLTISLQLNHNVGRVQNVPNIIPFRTK